MQLRHRATRGGYSQDPDRFARVGHLESSSALFIRLAVAHFESCRPVVIDHDILCDEQEPGVEFQIILRRHGGRQGKKDSVGLDVDWGNMERLVITKVKANGLVADWNR